MKRSANESVDGQDSNTVPRFHVFLESSIKINMWCTLLTWTDEHWNDLYLVSQYASSGGGGVLIDGPACERQAVVTSLDVHRGATGLDVVLF